MRTVRKGIKAVIHRSCKAVDHDGTRILDILRDVQTKLGSINGETMELLAEELSSHRVEIEGLVSF